MKFYFPEKITPNIISKIMDMLNDNDLKKFMSVEKQNDKFIVTFSKFGKSTFVFKEKKDVSGIRYELVYKNIAFMHFPIKNQLERKFFAAIETAGGSVL